MKKYSSANISDKQVLAAIQKSHEMGFDKYCYEILAEESGCPLKVCYTALERVNDKGYIDYGVSVRTAWLTDEGEAVLNYVEPEGLSMRQCFKSYCLENNIPYHTHESGVPKPFKEHIKSTSEFDVKYINNRYYICKK
jgi:hypothetical protein